MQKFYTTFLTLLMILTVTQAQNLIKKPKNQRWLDEARNQELKMRAFASGQNQDKAVVDNLCKLFVSERQQKFRETFAMHTKPIINKFHTHFSRVFNASGRLIEYNFQNPNERQDFENYIKTCFNSVDGKSNGIDAESFFTQKGVEAILKAPNRVLFVDFPTHHQNIKNVYTDARGRIDGKSTPCIGFVDAANIWDIESSVRGVEYIIIHNKFEIEKDKIEQYYIIDDEKYMLFEKRSGSKFDLISSHNHLFNKCPAYQICQEELYIGKPLKKGALNDSLEDLEAWVLLANLTKVYQWESGVPTKFEPKAQCEGFSTDQQYFNYSCGKGFINVPDNSEDGYTKVHCPTCERKRKEKFAWGKQIDIDLEYFNEERYQAVEAYLKSFGYADFGTEAMRFNHDDLEIKRRQIEFDVIGKGQEIVQTKEARNEIDVYSDIEDQKRVMEFVAKQIESAWKWCLKHIAISREYSSFSDCVIFLGRGFMLQSKKEHYQEYNELLEAGADSLLLNKKLSEIAQTDYGHDQSFIEIFELIAAVIPYRHTPKEVLLDNLEKFKENKLMCVKFTLALHSSELIQEFTTLNDLNSWGSSITRQAKFKRLKKYFYTKAWEIYTQETGEILLPKKEFEQDGMGTDTNVIEVNQNEINSNNLDNE